MEIRQDVTHELAAPHFPLLPRLEDVTEILTLVNDEEVSFNQIAKAMESRPIMAANIIRAVNSVSLATARPVRSLRHALTLMGLRSIRQLLAEMRHDAIHERQRHEARNTG